MYTSESPAPRPLLTVPELSRMKLDGRPIVALTAYDASFAAVMDQAGIDLVLVGDSLGMVVQGHASTLPVSLDDIVYHSAAVARGLRTALLVADMPFGADSTSERALTAALRMQKEGGAAMVKVEGAGVKLETIRFLVDREIPVCAHLGLTPQSVHRLGGYKVQGREEQAAEQLKRDAQAIVDAGATALVLECVPSALAAAITASVRVPTIGIGAGAGCDGQILVLHDLLGVSGGKRPRFVKNFLEKGGSVQGAFQAYANAVRSREFPAAEHAYA